MVTLLSRLLIKNHEQVTDPAVRRQYGVLCGAVGIGLNVLLFLGKFFAGTLAGSIAITADAFNNLSDAGSSFVTLLGFQLAGVFSFPPFCESPWHRTDFRERTFVVPILYHTKNDLSSRLFPMFFQSSFTFKNGGENAKNSRFPRQKPQKTAVFQTL